MTATDRVDREHGRHVLGEMVRIRRFEERCVELYSAAAIRGFVHLYIGEEAVAVGVTQALTPDDAVVASPVVQRDPDQVALNQASAGASTARTRSL